jgi:hypothetical protein
MYQAWAFGSETRVGSCASNPGPGNAQQSKSISRRTKSGTILLNGNGVEASIGLPSMSFIGRAREGEWKRGSAPSIRNFQRIPTEHMEANPLFSHCAHTAIALMANAVVKVCKAQV